MQAPTTTPRRRRRRPAAHFIILAFSIAACDSFCSLALYCVMEMSAFERSSIFLSFTSHNVSATFEISLKSCDTITTPPLNSLMASERASIDAASKWLVCVKKGAQCEKCQSTGQNDAFRATTSRQRTGSSNKRISGFSIASDAKTTLFLRPSDNV